MKLVHGSPTPCLAWFDCVASHRIDPLVMSSFARPLPDLLGAGLRCERTARSSIVGWLSQAPKSGSTSLPVNSLRSSLYGLTVSRPSWDIADDVEQTILDAMFERNNLNAKPEFIVIRPDDYRALCIGSNERLTSWQGLPIVVVSGPAKPYVVSSADVEIELPK